MGRHPEDETVRDVTIKLMMSRLEVELLEDSPPLPTHEASSRFRGASSPANSRPSS